MTTHPHLEGLIRRWRAEAEDGNSIIPASGLLHCADELEAALAALPGGGVEQEAAAWRWVTERAWFVDAGAYAFDLRHGPRDFTTEPHNADADEVRDAIYAAMCDDEITLPTPNPHEADRNG